MTLTDYDGRTALHIAAAQGSDEWLILMDTITSNKYFNRYHILKRAGDNYNFQSKSPTANGLITRLLTFSLLVHGKSTHTHRPLRNVNPLYILYYEYIVHSILSIKPSLSLRTCASIHSNTTITHLSTCILAHAITISISLQYDCCSGILSCSLIWPSLSNNCRQYYFMTQTW